MHSFRFGEYPVIWQHMPNLTGLTTDERGPASWRTAHLHKKHSSLNNIFKNKNGKPFLHVSQSPLCRKGHRETRDGIREQIVWGFK